MSNGIAITKKPVTVRAERYGDRDTGELTEDSLHRLASFVLGHEPADSTEFVSVIRPRTLFDPDDGITDLEVYDYLHDTWVTVFLGQWVIIGLKGETYPCDHEVLLDSYELGGPA